MLEAYRAQRWDDTERLIAQCRRLEPELDAFYGVYQERVECFPSRSARR